MGQSASCRSPNPIRVRPHNNSSSSSRQEQEQEQRRQPAVPPKQQKQKQRLSPSASIVVRSPPSHRGGRRVLLQHQPKLAAGSQKQKKKPPPFWALATAAPGSAAHRLSPAASSSSSTSRSDSDSAASQASASCSAALAMECEAMYEAALRRYFKLGDLAKLRAEDRRMRVEEGADNYGVGGYHRVHRGQLYNGRYLILSKLGWGHFSTVWMAADLHRPLGTQGHRLVALKVQKGEPSYLEAALDEVKLLQRVHERSLEDAKAAASSMSAPLPPPRGPGHIASTSASPSALAAAAAAAAASSSVPLAHMLDHFLVVSPNGKHMCTAFEVLGENLLQVMKRAPMRRLPLASVKCIARDVLLGLDFLHRRCDIIHTDLKPENVLVASSDPTLARALASGGRGEGLALDPTQVVVKIADLGNACWTHHHFTDYITTRQYRAPEVTLKAPYGPAADMWSFACLIFELITGEYLFDPKQNRAKGYSRNDDHLGLMLELMGPLPASVLAGASAASHYFDDAGNLLRLPVLDYWPLQELLHHKYHLAPPLARDIASFLSPALQLDARLRPTAAEHLRHPWLQQLPAASAPAAPIMVSSPRPIKPIAVQPPPSPLQPLPPQRHHQRHQQRQRHATALPSWSSSAKIDSKLPFTSNAAVMRPYSAFPMTLSSAQTPTDSVVLQLDRAAAAAQQQQQRLRGSLQPTSSLRSIASLQHQPRPPQPKLVVPVAGSSSSGGGVGQRRAASWRSRQHVAAAAASGHEA